MISEDKKEDSLNEWHDNFMTTAYEALQAIEKQKKFCLDEIEKMEKEDKKDKNGCCSIL